MSKEIDRLLESLNKNSLLNSSAPFFIYQEDAIQKNIDIVKNKLSSLGLANEQSKYFYSLKSNPSKVLAQIILQGFSGVDVSSQREYDYIKEAGVSPQSISVSGPAKTNRFIDQILRDEVYAVHLDSKEEYEYISKKSEVGRTKFSLRINLDETSSKLGMSFEVAKELLNTKRLKIEALHFYLGRESFSLEKLKAYLKIADDLNSLFPQISEIFIGPGFSCLDLENSKMEARFQKNNYQFHFEMGRSVLETTGAYLAPILSVKNSTIGKLEIIVNGGIQHIAQGQINFYKKDIYQTLFISNGKIVCGDFSANIFGSLCLSNDILAIVDQCPLEIRRGDWIYFFPYGAYNVSASANEFIMQDRADQYLLSGTNLKVLT